MLLFLSLNFLSYLSLKIIDSTKAKTLIEEQYGINKLLKIYPKMSSESLRHLLHETWNRWYHYEAFTQFKEKPIDGRYVNVSKFGYRENKSKNPWPANKSHFNVFVFGGSTTFGYGILDDQTIPAYLQDYLREGLFEDITVYNFGRSNYYSTQERVLFEKLIVDGHKPDLVVFIDGLNEFYHHENKPQLTEKLEKFIKNPNSFKKYDLAIFKVVRRIKKHFKQDDSEKTRTQPNLENVIARYQINKKMIEAIAKEMKIKTLFVWQPISSYKYDSSFHMFKGDSYGRHSFSKKGYPLAKKELANLENFIWLADIQENLFEPLYVDQVHYGTKLSKLIAKKISDEISATALFSLSHQSQ